MIGTKAISWKIVVARNVNQVASVYVVSPNTWRRKAARTFTVATKPMIIDPSIPGSVGLVK
jgi:hypothetical protein